MSEIKPVYLQLEQDALCRVEIEQHQYIDALENGLVTQLGQTKLDQPFYRQFVYIYLPGSRHPLKFRLDLVQGQKPYQAGFYAISLLSLIKPSQYDGISLVNYPRFSLLPWVDDVSLSSSAPSPLFSQKK